MPDRPVARAELAAMLSRLLTERLQDAEATTAYKDVDASHWAVQHISAMRPLGLMAGYPDSTFRPDQPVTRAEFAHAIVRLLTDKQATPAYLVNDIEGHWAQDSITRILAAKMMNGYPDGTFRPNSLLTRAEAVSTLNRLFGRLPLQGATSQYIDVPRSHWAYGDIMEASVERPLSSQVE